MFNNEISASELKERMRQITDEEDKVQGDRVFAMLRNLSGDKESLVIYERLRPRVSARLKELGYTERAETNSHYNETTTVTTITW